MEAILKQYFGYETFRYGQQEIIENILAGDNALGILPTGSGKSLCYQIPGLMFDGTTLVISPLISLMQDQVDSLKRRGISAECINSTMSKRDLNDVMGRLVRGELQFLYVAPERFNNEGFKTAVRHANIPFVAFDEAHCISKWGHDFRPSYQSIIPELKALLPDVQIIAVTATATEEVEENIQELLNIKNSAVFKTSVKRENLKLFVNGTYQREQFILSYIKERLGKSGIIYASTRAEVEKLATFLTDNEVENVIYHGGLGKKERNENQQKFISDEVKIVIATNAFGMGIDKPDIRYIIHFNLPGDLESYYQEIGRAGRDGNLSDCILLSTQRDINLQQFFIDRANASDQYKDHMREKLDLMLQYNKTSKCLSSFIVKYFDPNEYVEACGQCSSCQSSERTEPMTSEARLILELVQETDGQLSKELVIQVLRGESADNIMARGLDTQGRFGVLDSYRTSDVNHLVEELVMRGYVHYTSHKMYLVEKSFDILNSKVKLYTVPYRKHYNERVNVSTDSSPNEVLYDKLLNTRKDLADKYKLDEDAIFTDLILKEFAKKMPKSKQDMMHIQGVGNYKLKHYCPYFLEEIQQHGGKGI